MFILNTAVNSHTSLVVTLFTINNTIIIYEKYFFNKISASFPPVTKPFDRHWVLGRIQLVCIFFVNVHHLNCIRIVMWIISLDDFQKNCRRLGTVFVHRYGIYEKNNDK